MSDVTCMLNTLQPGDAKAADELLPLACEELCLPAPRRLLREVPDPTLQATALVHEACVGAGRVQQVSPIAGLPPYSKRTKDQQDSQPHEDKGAEKKPVLDPLWCSHRHNMA